MRRFTGCMLLACAVVAMFAAAPSAFAADPAPGEPAADTAHSQDPNGSGHETGHNGHAQKYGLMTTDGMTVLLTILVFIVLLVVLRGAAWKPVLNVLTEREKFIEESLTQAREDREAAEARLKQYEAKLAEAKAEATAIVEEGRRDAEVVKREIEESARKEADALVERARREIQIATDSAIKDLYELSANLATEVASRVIKKELNSADHQRLIADSIDELKRIERN